MKRLAILLLTAACAAAAIPAAARAASYDVLVCRAAPGNANHAFTATNDNPARLQAVDNCSSTEDYTGGLYAADALGAGFTTPTGQQVRWRMAAPAGLKITQLTGSIYVRNITDDSWTPFFRTRDGSVFQTCEIVPGDGYCASGYDNYYPSSPQTFAINTDGIEFGVSCDIAAGSCGNGFSLTSGLATISGAKITVTDNGAPSVSNLAGSLLAGSALRGAKAITFDAADASGISTLRLYVDGVIEQAVARTCDYTYAKPCQDATGARLTLDTTTLSDGAHTVRAAAVDAAGNEQRSAPQTITITNAPPTSAGSAGGLGGGGGAAGAPIAPAPPAWPSEPARAPSLPPPAVPSLLPATPTVGLIDARAHLSRARWRGATLRAAGRLTSRATGKITVALERRIRGRRYRQARTVRLNRGRWTVTMRLTGKLSHTTSATLAVTYAGNRTVKSATLRRTITRR